MQLNFFKKNIAFTLKHTNQRSLNSTVDFFQTIK